MKELFEVLESYLVKIIDHYGSKVKAIAIELSEPSTPVFVLIVLEGLKKVSFLAREDIAEYFIKKVEAEKAFSNFVLTTGHRPLIYTVFLDPTEVEYHIPLVTHILSKGWVVYGSVEVPKLNSYGNLIQLGEVNKGDVVDL